ncbi:alpha-ketoglutarate-dependent dioxygenase AlkB [Burkholderia pseudomallei]|uniref:alpha-ketoglutarate-dependent dioxygenase AlkB n=1 Tax=Burkholderia pseudomallei TaxID=28450 RepID=UPI0021F6C291|nr:alpha-ketoglutarate-dependent dioxygenase AlkB [Burkholderia pseudomallei]MCW0168581.1 alpha-ketoglutarate-dependent dioxygenase AlkB [Burkholderia pseudomallei]
MDDLFDDLPRPDADWHPDWLAPADADRFHARLVDEVAWRQDTMRTPRGLLPLPRLTAWQGEPELGAEPVIASLSLGATRVFDLRHNETGVTHAYRLTNGSLLVMRGRTQHAWRHRVPKEPAVRGERINLTFRWVSAPPAAERRARPRSRG